MATDLLPPPGEFKTTEEIRDARYADELRRKRKRMLLWSAPVMLLLLLAAIKLLSAVLVNAAGTSAYDDANHNTAADRYEALEFFNVVEPWKAHFNQGTAIYASGNFFGAQQELEVALDLVPKAPQGEPPGEEECAVRTNLSLSLEGLADEATLAGDPSMALNYLDQAQTALSSCGESGGGGGEEAQEAEERQEESQGEAEEQQEQQEGEGESGEEPTDGESSGEPTDGESSDGEPTDGESSGESSQDPSESGSDGQSSTPTESTDPQQEELESRNDEAQQSADADDQASGGGNGSGQNW